MNAPSCRYHGGGRSFKPSSLKSRVGRIPAPVSRVECGQVPVTDTCFRSQRMPDRTAHSLDAEAAPLTQKEIQQALRASQSRCALCLGFARRAKSRPVAFPCVQSVEHVTRPTLCPTLLSPYHRVRSLLARRPQFPRCWPTQRRRMKLPMPVMPNWLSNFLALTSIALFNARGSSSARAIACLANSG
jgi:hypothetical protein